MMKKFGIAILLLFSVCNISFAQINAGLEARLQYVLDSVSSARNIKGSSAAVLIPNVGIWKGAYGISHTGTPVTTDMLFGIGSNTKTFISSIMLRMQEQGLIDLDDTIGAWIQGVPHLSGAITIRQLLNHTSGLYNFTDSGPMNDSLFSDVTAIWQPEDFLPYLEAPNFAPGTDWGYCNTNYLLAGIIIEDVLNQPLADVLESYIFQPNNLNNTYLFPNQSVAGTVARPWSMAFSQPTHLEDLIAEYNYSMNANFSMAWAAGGILSTAEDNVIFWNKLMSEQIINTTSLQEMKQFIQLSGFKSYGLGLFELNTMNGRIAYSHGGSNIGFFNENMVDSEDGTCISVLTNQDSVTNNVLLTQLIAAMHKEVINYPLSIEGVSAAHKIQLSVYPNPAHDRLQISVDIKEELTAQLTDATGRLLAEKVFKDNTQLDVSAYATGVYLLQLNSKDGKRLQSRKVVVQNN